MAYIIFHDWKINKLLEIHQHTYNEQLRQINENKEKRLTELEAKLEETRRVNADLQQFRVLEKQAAERRQQNCMEMRHALQDQIGHRNDLQVNLNLILIKNVRREITI